MTPRLDETVLYRGHNVWFYGARKKIIPKLSLLSPLIWTSDTIIILQIGTPLPNTINVHKHKHIECSRISLPKCIKFLAKLTANSVDAEQSDLSLHCLCLY